MSGSPSIIVQESPFGWFGVRGDEAAVEAVAMGCSSDEEARLRLQPDGRPAPPPSFLLTRAAEQIARYFDGEPLNLTEIPIRIERQTPFQGRVRQALRLVGYGQTLSYAELAERAGAPRAARAVGTVMAGNLLPLLVPCHRVIGAGGKLGGFSAPQGLSLKQRLLQMEGGWRLASAPHD